MKGHLPQAKRSDLRNLSKDPVSETLPESPGLVFILTFKGNSPNLITE
jgi:hypothetical protein